MTFEVTHYVIIIPPEVVVLFINAVFLAFAYLGFYPSLPVKRWRVILGYDLAVTGAALLVAGLVYAGRGVTFDMIVAPTPWWVFSVLTFVIMEVPVWEWFRRRHGITYDDFFDDEDDQ